LDEAGRNLRLRDFGLQNKGNHDHVPRLEKLQVEDKILHTRGQVGSPQPPLLATVTELFDWSHFHVFLLGIPTHQRTVNFDTVCKS